MPKLIKTVKGKEIEMYADESQAAILLKDSRYRLAEAETKKANLNDETTKSKIDEIVSRGYSREYAVSIVEQDTK